MPNLFWNVVGFVGVANKRSTSEVSSSSPAGDEPFAARLGARMRDLRLERGISLALLKQAGGLTPSQMSSAERGRVLVTVGTVAAVANALGVPPFLLLAFPEEDALAAVVEEIRQAYGGDLRAAAEVIRARLLADEASREGPEASSDGPPHEQR